jgi:hypothetical protein
MEQPMTRNDFLRKAIHCFITPTKTAYNVSAGEGKHILEQFAGSYVSRGEFIELMIAEGFAFRETGVYSGHFRANYKCGVATLLNNQWSREYIRSHLGRREYERWDSICDAIVVLKHMCLNSHGKLNVGNVDTAVADILNHKDNADIPESDPVAN